MSRILLLQRVRIKMSGSEKQAVLLRSVQYQIQRTRLTLQHSATVVVVYQEVSRSAL